MFNYTPKYKLYELSFSENNMSNNGIAYSIGDKMKLYKLFEFSFATHQPGINCAAFSSRRVESYETDKGLNSPLVLYIATKYKTGTGDFVLNGKTILAPFPGCCGAAISTGLEIFYQYRGTGKYKFLHHATKTLAKSLGYSLLVATIDMSNIPEVKNTVKESWNYSNTFKNERTGNLLSLITQNLSSVTGQKLLFEETEIG